MRRQSLILLAVAAACGGEGDARGGAGWLRAAAEPVTLKPVLDTGHAQSRRISAARGGTIAAMGGDGTRYTLSIPDSALLSDAVITLTPVRSLTGLPLGGGSVAAVHIEPSGLRLLRAATLSIAPAVEIPVSEQVAYGYVGRGEDAYRHPLGPDRARIELQLFHFSGYGVGRAAPDDPGRQALVRASSEMARLQARLAEYLDRARAAGEDDAEAARFAHEGAISTAIEWYYAVLVPLIERAESDERVATCCVQAILDWERSIQLLGMGTEDPARDAADPDADSEMRRLAQLRVGAAASLRRIMDAAYTKGMERAVSQCRERHDLNALVPLLALERQAQLLGFPPEPSRLDEAMRALGACMQFEVELRSRFETRSAEATMVHEVEAKVPVDASWEQHGKPASAPLRYVRYAEHLGPGAPMNVLRGDIVGIGSRPGTTVVQSIEWDRNPRSEPGLTCEGKDEQPDETEQAKAVRDTAHLVITFRPGRPTEIQRATIARANYTAVHESHTWADEFERAHARDQIGEWTDEEADVYEPIYRMDLRQTAPGVWRADFEVPDRGDTPGITMSESGHLIVRHRPRGR